MTDLLWKLERVTLRGTSHAGRDSRDRLADVTLEINRGTTAIVGYSGAGKTSLLNLLVGFERPDAGSVTSSLAESEGRLPLYWVPQNDGLWPHLTAGDHLEAVLPLPLVRGESSDDRRLRIAAILALFDLEEKTGSLPAHLSQGERARLSLARALASEAWVLVLDEPLVHVDPGRIAQYRERMRDFCHDKGISLVIATHAPELVLSDAHRAVCLESGGVVYAGPVEELYYRPATEELAAFLGAANWLSPDEARLWFESEPRVEKARGLGNGHAQASCYRPEQIAITATESSRFVVESSRFAGSMAEVEIRDEQSQRRQRFFHRPARDLLQRGDRVRLTFLVAAWFCLGLIGCGGGGGGGGPSLSVREVNYWSMPPSARAIPAPRSVTSSPQGEIYALDTAGRVLVFDSTGHVVREWKMPEYDVGRPEGICVFKDGRIAVSDTHYHRVVIFDRVGKVLKMSGSLGEEPGQFIYPVAVTQDEEENYYICEYGSNDRVQKFSVNGEFLLQFGHFGTAPGEFQRPSGIVWHNDRVYVADAMNNRVQMFSDTGEFIKVFLSSDTGGALHYPYDLSLNSKHELYVIEYGAGRLSKFDLNGNLLGRFGATGRGEGQFSTPWGLTTNSVGNVYVADTGNRRIVEIRP